jgi:hypothetical protein
LFYIVIQIHFIGTYFDFAKSISFSKVVDSLGFVANFAKYFAFCFY